MNLLGKHDSALREWHGHRWTVLFALIGQPKIQHQTSAHFEGRMVPNLRIREWNLSLFDHSPRIGHAPNPIMVTMAACALHSKAYNEVVSIICSFPSHLHSSTSIIANLPMGRHDPLRYGFGICPVSAWFAKLATISSSICERVRSCMRANFGAEYEARSPFTTFVRIHSLWTHEHNEWC